MYRYSICKRYEEVVYKCIGIEGILCVDYLSIYMINSLDIHLADYNIYQLTNKV